MQNPAELEQHPCARAVLSSFDQTDVGTLRPGLQCQAFLRQALAPAEFSESGTYGLINV